MSDSSIATASTVSEQERTLRLAPGHRQVPSGGRQERVPIRVFVTTNFKLFALVDLTEIETADAIRRALCFAIGVQEWDSVSIYHTEVGQTTHGMLTFIRSMKALADTALPPRGIPL